MDALKRRLAQTDEKLQEVLEDLPLNAAEAHHQQDNSSPRGPVYRKVLDSIDTFTNFTEAQVLDLWRDVDPQFVQRRGRGKQPSLDSLDSLIVFLIHLKSNIDIGFLAAILDMKETTVRDCINRTRAPLYAALQDRWSHLPRPKRLSTTSFPFIGLLVDSTTIPVFKPKGHFDEVKSLWDSKNHTYGFKKEVAVMASQPHYALFMQPKADGSRHDYSIFKDSHTAYTQYLNKTPTERGSYIPGDSQDSRWAILGDNGYQGPASDTPSVRRIFIEQLSRVTDQRLHDELKKLHVPVECFFGRLKHLWQICHNIYRLSHQFFDQDIDICLWLTNEHIKHNHLSMDDHRVFLAHIVQHEAEVRQASNKTKAQQQRWKEAKKARLEREVSGNLSESLTN
jgi:hypothetical protein